MRLTMKTKLGKSVTVWMLKSVNTDSFLAIDGDFWLCPYYQICKSEMIVGPHKVDVEHIAKWWNRSHKLHKVEPVKVRVSLEFLAEEADDEE